MQMSDSGSDAEMEIDEVNQKLQDENDDNEGEEEKLEPEDEEEAEQEVCRYHLLLAISTLILCAQDVPESEEASPPPSPPKQPRLKIKLKLPSAPSTEDTGSRGRSGGVSFARATDCCAYDAQIST
jgi:Ino eighty subunit 2